MAEFQALVVELVDGQQVAALRRLTLDDLPPGDVLVQVEYSSLNYKDGLAVTGKGKVIRSFPMVPGIDFAGTVVDSADPAYAPGDKVVLTGWGVGEAHWGGYAGFARVRGEWLVPLPRGMSSLQAMAVGTAGLTAMLAIMALEEHPLFSDREILVTGAAGGVGSMAVQLLAGRGHKVAAATGRPEQEEYLRSLGASSIIPRQDLAEPCKPLLAERWGGAVDTVGGQTLATVLAGTAYGCTVAACGLAGGMGLPTSVMPFILRGVRLIGIDSVHCPLERRRDAWDRLAIELPGDFEDHMGRVAPLADVPRLAEDILAGQIKGRVVIDVKSQAD